MSKWYVTMNDSFMSYWGKAEGKINKLVFECDSFQEASKLEDYARGRDEMKYINITRNKPKYSNNRYYVQYLTKNDYPNWYGL